MASLTEAPAPSLFHVEVKMTLVSFIGTGSEHGSEDTARIITDCFQECSFGVV